MIDKINPAMAKFRSSTTIKIPHSEINLDILRFNTNRTFIYGLLNFHFYSKLMCG